MYSHTLEREKEREGALTVCMQLMPDPRKVLLRCRRAIVWLSRPRELHTSRESDGYWVWNERVRGEGGGGNEFIIILSVALFPLAHAIERGISVSFSVVTRHSNRLVIVWRVVHLAALQGSCILVKQRDRPLPLFHVLLDKGTHKEKKNNSTKLIWIGKCLWGAALRLKLEQQVVSIMLKWSLKDLCGF